VGKKIDPNRQNQWRERKRKKKRSNLSAEGDSTEHPRRDKVQSQRREIASYGVKEGEGKTIITRSCVGGEEETVVKKGVKGRTLHNLRGRVGILRSSMMGRKGGGVEKTALSRMRKHKA